MIFEYTLVRSQRRTVAIHIKDGCVEVRAPMKMPKRDIDRFVAAKDKWITGRFAESQSCAKQREAFTIDYGAFITFCGMEYPLTAKAGKCAGFDGERFYLPPDLSPEQIKSAVVQIYQRLIKLHLTERVKYFAGLMGVLPAAIKINGAKTRWGSCSAKKSLNFTWRLVMADEAMIDYVVVHELAHISEMNHSIRFWAIVAGVQPDYKEQQKRLKEINKRLSAENWD